MLSPFKYLMLGSDPEGFLQQDGKIIGSEKVIPKEGLRGDYRQLVVLDGVQFELHPSPANDPAHVGASLKKAFIVLSAAISRFPGVSVSFRGVVDVEQEELDSLSPETRVLGCLPSENFYGMPPLNVDASTYTKRSAGGHIHFGLDGVEGLLDKRLEALPYFDIFVGNTGVLLDRDPGAVERRLNYGRAGEYRTPNYGVEYRTLSNFWLRHSSIMDLMFRLGHAAVAITHQRSTFEAELMEVVNIDKVIGAIQTNNWDLARLNFEAIRPFIVKHFPGNGAFGLHAGNIDKFSVLAQGVQANGLEAYFPVDPVRHWSTEPYTRFDNHIASL